MNTPDLPRRKMLGFLGGAGLVALAACNKDAVNSLANSTTSSTTSSTSTSTTAAAGATTSTTAAATTATTAKTTATTQAASGSVDIAEIPTETGGPYPADGTNGPNALTTSGVVRRDITTSFGAASGKADGVPLEIVLTIMDADTDKPLPGAAVYLWHCDRGGQYSLYSQAIASENYLRGVQVADTNGVLHFTSIFPAAYSGRWPHIHFEIFDSLSKATSGRNARKVTQLALPKEICQTVYASSGYESSQANLSRTSLSTDMVFSDGYDHQLAAVVGSVAGGYTASLTVGV